MFLHGGFPLHFILIADLRKQSSRNRSARLRTYMAIDVILSNMYEFLQKSWVIFCNTGLQKSFLPASAGKAGKRVTRGLLVVVVVTHLLKHVKSM